MKYKKKIYKLSKCSVIVYLWLLASPFIQATEPTTGTNSTVVQVSTIQALLTGIYDGEMTVGQLKTVGDFGFGTFNGFDGEMVALDRKFYQVKVDGSVHVVTDSMKTPYATVHSFQTDKEILLTEPIQSYQQFQKYLDQHLLSRNQPYGLKITGTFDYLKVRSVPKQSKPYPPAVEILKRQATFKFKNITGTLVGYWFPDYLDKITVPSYHLHFISADKQRGGHLLDCRFSTATIALDLIESVKLLIPQDNLFQSADLSTYSQKDLDKRELFSIEHKQ